MTTEQEHKCEPCNGTGSTEEILRDQAGVARGVAKLVCQSCNGTGIEQQLISRMKYMTCTGCDGNGMIARVMEDGGGVLIRVCQSCHGSGNGAIDWAYVYQDWQRLKAKEQHDNGT